MKRAALTLLVALAAFTTAAAQPAAGPYSVRVWQTDDGLPRNSVQAIEQTHDGYLWIGTQRGLVRFDGVRFTNGIAEPALARHSAQQSVRALLVTRDGSLWVGLDGGGLLERDTTGRTRRHDLGELSPYVRALAESAAGVVYVGTASGLGHYVGGRWSRVASVDVGPGGAVYALREDRGGVLWIGTSQGVIRLDGGSGRRYSTRDGLAHDSVWAIGEDPSGAIWAGTRGGLSRFSNVRPAGGFSHMLAGDAIRAVHVDRDGRLWIGTDAGLHQARDGRLLQVSPGTRPIEATVFCLFEDRESNLWVGTNAGLHRVRPGQFGTITVEQGLPHNVVLPVLEDRRGRVWMGTWGGGLVKREAGRVEVFTRRAGLPDDRVFALLEDRRGTIWVGTESGVARGTASRFERVSTIDFATTGRALVLYEDRQGAIWMGADRGLFRIDERGAHAIRLGTDESTLRGGAITAIVEDDRRHLWIAAGPRLFVLDEPRRASGRLVSTMPAAIRAAHVDAAGALWLSTAGGGLVRFQNGRAFRFDATHGLGDDEILAMLLDGIDRFWFSTKRGLTRVSRQQLEEVALGRAGTVQVSAYGARDGMASTECSGDASPAAWRRRDGTLLFPTTRGVVVVDPTAIAPNPAPPLVAIEEVLHGRHPLDLAAPLELAPGRGDLEVRYTAPSFVASEKIRFWHRLDGRDTDWVDAGTRRAAFYTNLPPGAYRFQVRASNEDGVWSARAANVAITVQPHLYQTRAFLFACLAACALAAWAAYAVRMRQLTVRLAAVKGERNRMAREIHDTLLQGMAGIGYQLEAVRHRLRSEPDAAEQHLDRVAEHVDACLGEARRSVRNMRSKWLEQHDLAAALHDAGRLLVGGADIDLRVDVFGTPRPLDPEVENQCLRIGQEAMANAVAHACPSRVDVAVHFKPAGLRLTVADDGRGFAPDTPAADQSYGLVGIGERARQLGARVRIASRIGRGTRLTLDVPTSRWQGLVRAWRRRGRPVVFVALPGEDVG